MIDPNARGLLRGYAMAAIAAGVLMGGCDAGGNDPAPVTPPGEGGGEVETVGGELSAKVTTCRREGDVVRFAMKLACKNSETKCKEHDLAIEHRVYDSGPDFSRMQQVVTRRGQSLIEMEVGSDASNFSDEFRHYYAPITGIEIGVITNDGGTIWATIDDRSTWPAPAGTRFEDLSFMDGRPRPSFVVPSDLKPLLTKLYSLGDKEFEKCTKKLGGTGGTAATLIIGGNPGHTSNTINNTRCRAEQGFCEFGHGHCVWSAVGGAVACGPFAFLCGVGGLAGCAAAKLICLKGAHRSGGPCCPVDCGGGGKAHNLHAVLFQHDPIQCCSSGEQCLLYGAGFCCSSNEPKCGGRCCGAPNTCVNRGTTGEYCCEPHKMCGTQCCFDYQECRQFGAQRVCQTRCQTNDDCGLDERCTGGFCQ